jgi:glycosyltransferase involved in cell wall biosynthesis
MKVAMVSEHASPLATLGGTDAGGQNVHVAALATALGAVGHEIVVHTRRDDPALPEYVDFAPGVRVHHVDAGPARPVPKDDLFGYMPEFAARLQVLWRCWQPEIVHSHFWMSGWAALQAGRAFGLPVVHTFHALGITKRRHQGAKDTSPEQRIDVERSLARSCTRIVATSTEELFELLRMGAKPFRVSVVPCGVDLEHFNPQPLRRSGDRCVLVVSRLVERKGIGNVVTAMRDVPDARLLIAGGPAPEALERDIEVARLRALARGAGVDDRVTCLGRVGRDALPALYGRADVVACVPWYEPFGLVALEAMATARPVVASAVGGLIDTIIDGVTGLHVAPRRPEAIAAALRRLLDDEALRASLGKAGAHRARSRYSWRTVAAETFDAYRAARTQPARARTRVG